MPRLQPAVFSTAIMDTPVSESRLPSAKPPVSLSVMSGKRNSGQPDASSLTQYLQKTGVLQDCEIDVQLARLNAQDLSKIKPEEPLFYLLPVYKNSALKKSIAALQHQVEAVEHLCGMIDRGEWDQLTHLPMQCPLPNGQDWSGVAIKDALFFAFAANRISAAEFNTAHMTLNIKEQFGLEVNPEYICKAPGRPAFVEHLPSVKRNFVLEKIFGEDGITPTAEGLTYARQVASNLFEGHEIEHYLTDTTADKWVRSQPAELQTEATLGDTTRQKWTDDLLAAWRSLPANLQYVYKIDGKPASDAKPYMQGPMMYWQAQYRPAPFPLVAKPTRKRGNEVHVATNESFYSPSAGLMAAFLIAYRRETAIFPRLCLGTIGIDKLAEMHLAGHHPVLARDTRIRSNYLAPHMNPAGAWDGYAHDMFFHLFCASTYSLLSRQHVCRDYVQALAKLPPPAHPAEKFVHEWIKEGMIDMPSMGLRKNTSQAHLYSILTMALLTVVAVDERFIVLSGLPTGRSERLDIAFDVLKRFLTQIKALEINKYLREGDVAERYWKPCHDLLLAMESGKLQHLKQMPQRPSRILPIEAADGLPLREAPAAFRIKRGVSEREDVQLRSARRNPAFARLM